MSLSRSTPSRATAHAAAFDFDVVSDAPARPSRKPEATPQAAPSEADVAAKPEVEAVESR